MKKQIVVLGISLSILFLSISIHNLAAQNVTTNASNPAGNLSASNLSNATGNLTVFANQTLDELGQKLITAFKDINMTLQSENSSLGQLEQNASDLGADMLNKTEEAAK